MAGGKTLKISKALPSLGPRAVFGSEDRFREKGQEGVGLNYVPESFTKANGKSRRNVNPSMRFDTSKRFGDKGDENEVVGPGLYALDTPPTAKGGSFPKAGRFTFDARTATPDHYYTGNAMSGSSPLKAKGASIPKAKRFGSGADSISPGPQYFTPLTANGAARMGTSKRFVSSISTSMQTPGPNFMPSSTKKTPAGKFDKQRRWADGSTAATAEVKTTYVPDTTLTPVGAPKFGTSSRFGNEHKATNTTGSDYNPVSFDRVGTSRRNVNTAPRFDKSARFKDEGDNARVGPNYAPESFASFANGKSDTGRHGTKFTKATRWDKRPNTTSPGPIYLSDYGRKSSNVKFDKQRRFSSGKTTSPGPNYMGPGIERTGSFVKWRVPRKEKAGDVAQKGPSLFMPPPTRAASAATFGTAKRFAGW